MFPSLLSWLPSYGVLLLTGVMVAIFLFRREVSRYPLDKEAMTDIIIVTVLGGFLGARLLQVVVMHDYYLESIGGLWRVLALWDGGFAYLGGVLAGSLIIWLFRKRIPLALTADAMVLPLAVNHFFGRLGCFAAGCCHGRETTGLFGVHFSPHGAAQSYCTLENQECLKHTALLPTQLFEALLNLGIVVFLSLYRKRKPFHGAMVAWYLILYGVIRFTLELFRGDATRGYVVRIQLEAVKKALGFKDSIPLLLSTSQLLSLGLIAAGIVLYKRKKKARSDTPH